jgi:hypothetical protein
MNMNLTMLTARQPLQNECIRVDPDAAYRHPCTMLRDCEGKLWLVSDDVDLPEGELELMMIFLAMNSDQEMFLWPVPLPIDENHPAFAAMHEWWWSSECCIECLTIRPYCWQMIRSMPLRICTGRGPSKTSHIPRLSDCANT